MPHALRWVAALGALLTLALIWGGPALEGARLLHRESHDHDCPCPPTCPCYHGGSCGCHTARVTDGRACASARNGDESLMPPVPVYGLVQERFALAAPPDRTTTWPDYRPPPIRYLAFEYDHPS